MNVKTVFVLLLTISYSVFCDDSEEVTSFDDYEDPEENRNGKQLIDPYDNKGWRVIDSDRQPNSDDWKPKEGPASVSIEISETVIPRRRRLKKRKRRPPPPVTYDEGDESVEVYHRRRVKPQTLEEINDSWPDIEEEAPDYPRINFNRRRITPTYAPEPLSELERPLSVLTTQSEDDEKPKRVYEKVRNPFAALEEAEAKAKKKKEQEVQTTISPLKALLKQSGGSLNLSEILQQKNLSLNDLIQGNPQAISALTEVPETSTVQLLSTFAAENKPNLENDKYTEKYPISLPLTTIKRLDVISQPTTERRIFVPSHPKYYSTYKYKHNILKVENSPATSPKTPITTSTSSIIITTTNTSSTSTGTKKFSNKYVDFRSKYVTIKPKIKPALLVTSEKVTESIGKNTSTTVALALPAKAMAIDIKDLLGFPKLDVKNESKTLKNDEGPLKMTIDLKDMMKQPMTKNSLETTTNQEKIMSTSARDEIMEVLSDHASRQNLARILQIRNMTIEELVAQRERGSSQLHLADIFHNQTREPEPPNEPYIGHISELPEIFFNRKAKSLEKVNTPTKHSATRTDLKDDIFSTTIKTTTHTVVTFPTYKIEMDKIIKNNKEIPFQISILKSLYPNLYKTENATQKSSDLLKNNKESTKRIEEIENTISEIVNEQFSIDSNANIATKYENENSYLKLPLGTKTAIIGSAAIVGVSLVVFLTIFIIFKWSQKQKKRLCYSNSFLCSRIKTPILEPESKRSIKTIMCETLGKKKRYTNYYPQTMSDYLWENDGKPFQ